MYDEDESLRSYPASPAVPRFELRPGLSRGMTAYGEVFYRDQYFPLDHKHGRFRLQAALACDDELLDRLGPDLTVDDIRGAAYLDIETSSSSDGPGTHAFMVGVGTFEGLWFRVRQYFLVDPQGERAMLAGLSETIDRCKAIVTFNGRGFDLPQLATRYGYARLPDPHAELPHIDLLYPARLLFTGDLASCRLAEIELELLKFRRRDDEVPGALIPDLYAAYVRRRNTRGLHPIFEHNSHDVLSLVALIAYLNHAAGNDVSASARHHYRLGRWDEQRGRTGAALENHRLAWESDAHGPEGGQAIVRLTHGLMRTDDWQECVGLWSRELEQTNRIARRVRACIELAKLYERKLHDPAVAHRFCLEGLEAIDHAPSRQSFVLSIADLEKRIARLEPRLAKAAHKASA